MPTRIVLTLALCVAFAPGNAVVAQVDSSADSPREVLVIRVDDVAITPVTAGYIKRAIDEATSVGAAALVIELDTPGGLMESTRDIVKDILGSQVPVVVFVSPSGARAASAGVFITLSAHVAAMAPATHIGAAHPVSLGGSPGLPAQPDTSGSAAQNSVMNEKVVNDARAWARTLAELHGRNADWAEAAVSESKSIPATEALELNVVDLIASDIAELLAQIDGREIEIGGQRQVLQVEGSAVRSLNMWWGERVLSVLSNPNFAFLLLMFGFYGILFEFYSPGWGISGTLGAVCLVLAFFGLAVLPINYAGLVLILLAVGLFVAEAFFTSFGMLTIGGAVCLILGALMLVDTPMPVMRVSLSLVVPFAAASAILAFFLGSRVMKSHRTRVRTGAEGMLGEKAVVKGTFEKRYDTFEGVVAVHGELWRAQSARPLPDGTEVRVTGQKNLTLSVQEAHLAATVGTGDSTHKD
jgi:membrane-bound serine protease (ClpP class)